MRSAIFFLIFIITQLVQPIEPPEFSESINLFKERNLGEEMRKQSLSLYERFIAMICSMPRTKQLVHTASGDRTTREVAHQNERIEIYSGTLVLPKFIILSKSGHSDLQTSIDHFFKQANTTPLAHNFFIDKHGNIHPVTKPKEAITAALKHRPFAVGVSCSVTDEGKQERDMNSHSITISVIGKEHEKCSAEQTKSLIHLIQWLSEQYSITPDHILDYGCIAQPYGRRNISLSIPWQELHNQGVACYQTIPKNQIYQPKPKFSDKEFTTLWASTALERLGYVSVATTNPQNSTFIAALKMFQQFYQCDQTDGNLTPHTLATIQAMLETKNHVKPDDTRWPHN